MKTESYRELKVLEELTNGSSPTQRHLSKKLGVALGLTNLMIRRCVNKGYLKIVNAKKNRIHYLLTPKGVSEKTRLTHEYLEYSLHLYRSVRQILKETLGKVAENGGKNILFFGRGELAEITYLSVKEAGLQLICLVDDGAAGETFLGTPVISIEKLNGLSFDCGIISSLHKDWETLHGRLQELGIPKEKILVIEQNGAHIRAVLPDFAETAGQRALS